MQRIRLDEHGAGQPQESPNDAVTGWRASPARGETLRKLAFPLALMALAVALVGWQFYQGRAQASQRQRMAQEIPGRRGGPGGGPGGPGGGPGGPGGGWNSPQMRTQMLERMSQELGLTEAQKTEIEAIQKEYEPKLAALREHPPADQDQRRQQFRQLRDEQRQKMRAVLTPEQQTTFDQMRGPGRRGERGGRQDGRRGSPPADSTAPPTAPPATP